MKKSELFIRAMNSDLYRSKRWVITAFSVFKSDVNYSNPYEISNSENIWFVFNPDTKNHEPITDESGKNIPINEPVFKFTENVDIFGEQVPNLKQAKITTTYGRLLANYILLIYPFNDKLSYINEEIKIGNIENMIKDKLVDKYSPDYDAPNMIKIEEYKEFVKAVGQLEGFSTLCVPTVTEKSLTTNPMTKEIVAQLKEKYKGQLNDPLIIAKIDAEVERLDKEWIKGDPSERFFLKDKAYGITRKKMYGVYGGEAGLGDGSTMDFIDKPLTEGIDTKQLPTMINSLRAGSYDRGTETALGGVAVKQFFRVFQNSNITQKDCGSTIGIKRNVRKDNLKRFIGFYHLVNKSPVLITEEIAKSLIDKEIEMRSPATCKTPLTDYCEVCMGENNSRNKQGLGASASEIGSNFMILFLKSMHGKSLRMERLNLKSDIS